MSLVPCRDRHSVNDNLPACACFCGLYALNAAQRRGLFAACNRREAHLVTNIGGGIAVRIDL
jgi:hypothetical protein